MELSKSEETNLLQDKLKKNEKRQNQFQNGLKHAKKIQIKERQNRLKQIVKMQNFFQTKKMQNILQNILQNKIEPIKKGINLLQDNLKQSKKRQIYWKKDRVYFKMD